MNHKADSVTCSVPEVVPMAGVRNDGARSAIDGFRDHARANAPARRGLRAQDQRMDFARTGTWTSYAIGSRDIGEITVRFRSEVESHQFTRPDDLIRCGSVRHGAVPAGRHDSVEGRPAGPVFAHDAFELECEIAFAGARPDVVFQLPKGLFSPLDRLPDALQLLRVLAHPEFRRDVAASLEFQALLPKLLQRVDRDRCFIEPDRFHMEASGGFGKR